MKILYKLLLVVIIITLHSCSKDKKEISQIKEINQEMEMISTYRDAVEIMNDGDYFYAAKKFLESELLFPQSDWAPKSAIMASYAYYVDGYYDEAIFNLERYIKTYPRDERLDYAHFLLAMCHYQTIVDEKKDLQPLITAKNKFQFVINNYPNTDFSLDSKFKIDLINDILASKEMYLGRYYIKKEKWIPAINRFKNILKNYETTIYTEEAIHRLVEIHYHIGLLEESKKYANLLGYNYQSSDWYKKSYKLFNKNYKTQKLQQTVQKNKKEKNGIIEKFKKLF
jgi:outer membrane protein assembly factor BamD